jgi:nicotinate-nucleotide pyrophosphorylase (carboxylating)
MRFRPRTPGLPSPLTDPRTIQLVRLALEEDVGSGDATSESLVPATRRMRAAVLTREPCVVCGGEVAAHVFRSVDPAIHCHPLAGEGAHAAAGEILLRIEGPARGILTAERTALNFLQRLSGIATLTADYVARVKPYGTAILDTRKTAPGQRALEKYAVRCGGGTNHRAGLYDRVLIKDNHRRLWGEAGGDLGAAVEAARRACPWLPVEIEVESLDELRAALRGSPDWVLLDNMPLDLMARCVAECRGRAKVEASGGISLDNVAAVAATGVDAISVGRLTHSARAVDLSLEIETDDSPGR